MDTKSLYVACCGKLIPVFPSEPKLFVEKKKGAGISISPREVGLDEISSIKALAEDESRIILRNIKIKYQLREELSASDRDLVRVPSQCGASGLPLKISMNHKDKDKTELVCVPLMCACDDGGRIMTFAYCDLNSIISKEQKSKLIIRLNNIQSEIDIDNHVSANDALHGVLLEWIGSSRKFDTLASHLTPMICGLVADASNLGKRKRAEVDSPFKHALFANVRVPWYKKRNLAPL